MSSLNKVQLIGNVGRDPEIRNLNSGDKVANLAIATSERWKDQSGQQKEKTEWHSVVVFGALVGVIERFVKKGSKLFLEGKLQTRKWQDQTGTDRHSTEVVLSGYGSSLIMLDGRGDNQSQPQAQQNYNQGRSSGGSQMPNPHSDFDDDLDAQIPF